MIYALFLGSIFCLKAARRVRAGLIRAKSSREVLTAVFAGNLLYFLVPFAIVTGFYATLAAVVAIVDSDTTVHATLVLLQAGIKKGLEFSKDFRLESSTALFIIAISLVIASWPYLLPRKLAGSVHTKLQSINRSAFRWFVSYSKLTSLLYTFLVLLSSFSFFSSGASALEGKLDLRIAKISDQHSSLAAEIDQAVKKEIVNNIVEHVLEHAPQDINEAIQKFESAWKLGTDLRQHYDRVASNLGANLQITQRISRSARRYDAISEEVYRLRGNRAGLHDLEYERAPSDRYSAVHNQISIDLLRQNQADVELFGREFSDRQVAIAELPQRRTLTVTAVSMLVDSAFQGPGTFIDDIPFAEHVLAAVTLTIKQVSSETIENELISPILRDIATYSEPRQLGITLLERTGEFVSNRYNPDQAWEVQQRQESQAIGRSRATTEANANELRSVQIQLTEWENTRTSELQAERDTLTQEIDRNFERIENVFRTRAQIEDFANSLRLRMLIVLDRSFGFSWLNRSEVDRKRERIFEEFVGRYYTRDDIKTFHRRVQKVLEDRLQLSIQTIDIVRMVKEETASLAERIRPDSVVFPWENEISTGRFTLRSEEIKVAESSLRAYSERGQATALFEDFQEEMSERFNINAVTTAAVKEKNRRASEAKWAKDNLIRINRLAQKIRGGKGKL